MTRWLAFTTPPHKEREAEVMINAQSLGITDAQLDELLRERENKLRHELLLKFRDEKTERETQLRAEILEGLSGRSAGEHEAGFLTNVRHQRLVEESLTSLAVAQHAVRGGIPHEMIMMDLYSALRPLDAITGETTADDILNRIFSTFCIGK